MPQLVCPNCNATNRLPEGRSAAAAKCGRCHEKLFTGHPAEVTAAQLDAHRRSTQGAARLLDVWAPWCGPCRAMAPQFAKAAERLEPDVRALKLNSDEHPQAAAALGVQGIPALFLIRDNKVVGRQAGLMNASQIEGWVRETLAQTRAA
jgi:thioredoxin 2